jgi:cytochrome c oxidase assembly protein subunit 15
MDAQSLYDLAPLARVMFMGAVIALGPVLWVWRRHRRAAPMRRLHALTLLTLFLTFDLVLFGAFTRLTDSGLGCPDWPGCYGRASPLEASAPIAAAQSAMPTGPVTQGKAWVEMVHRYVATGVGVLILVLAVAAWLAPVRVHPWWPTLTLVWVCIQGAFGALTVTMKLFPAIVTLHLLAGLVLLAMLCVQVMHRDEGQEGTVPVAVSPALRAMLWLGFGLVMLQAALGGWVSTNYAVLACSDFPRCQARWWPEMNFEQGFQIWRPLGFTQDGSYISFAALTAIHVVHRMMAAVVLLVMGLLAGWLNTVAGLRMASRWLAALIILQMATGLSNVVFSWPLVAAVLHTGGAAAMLIVITRILVATSTERSVAA